MSYTHFAITWAYSMQMCIGRSNVDRDQVVSMLVTHAERCGIHKITKMRVQDVDRLVEIVATPRQLTENYFNASMCRSVTTNPIDDNKIIHSP